MATFKRLLNMVIILTALKYSYAQDLPEGVKEPEDKPVPEKTEPVNEPDKMDVAKKPPRSIHSSILSITDGINSKPYPLTQIVHHALQSQAHLSENRNKATIQRIKLRKKRNVIEEDKYYNERISRASKSTESASTQWLPQTLPINEEVTTDPPMMNNYDDKTNIKPPPPTTEALQERKIGRGARGAASDHWVKLPYPNRDSQIKDQMASSQPTVNDNLTPRIPRVNFVTQNKGLETSETRHEDDYVPRSAVIRDNELRTDFLYPDSRARSLEANTYIRPTYYYPEDSRRRYIDDVYYPTEDYYVRRDPYYDIYAKRRNDYPYRSRLDRYEGDLYDAPVSSSLNKPKRIIYYAHLPEVVRSPPSVDLRYKYNPDYRRFDDYYNTLREGRYDYRFRNGYEYNRYPYSALKKESRDLISSGSDPKDKRAEESRYTTEKPKDQFMSGRDPMVSKNNHYPINLASSVHVNEPLHKLYPDVARLDHGYKSFDHPSFQAPIDDPFADRHD